MRRASLTARLCLDALMAVFFISGLAFRTTGRSPHEWIGLGFVLLFGLHLAVNFGWCRALFKGNYGARRILNSLTNMALLIAMVILCVAGVMNSRHVFGFSQYFDGEDLRRLHSAGAYWSLVFIGIHTGLHWEMIMGTLRKFARGGWQSRFVTFGLQFAALLVVLSGVWASYDRAMGSKLFLGFAFDFWDSDRPLALFYAANFAIVGIYATAAHYTLKLVKIRNRISER